MSVITFELKEEHLKLLKHLRWSMTDKDFIVSTENVVEDIAPFGVDSLYEGIDLILNGRPADFDPLNSFEPIEYSEEQRDEWDKLYSELPLALEVILYNGHLNLGTYKARYHDRQWKELK